MQVTGAQDANAPMTWETIAEEVLLGVFKFCRLADFSSLRLVCRTWKRVSHDESLAKVLGRRELLGYQQIYSWQQLRTLRVNLAAGSAFESGWWSLFTPVIPSRTSEEFGTLIDADTEMHMGEFVDEKHLSVLLNNEVWLFNTESGERRKVCSAEKSPYFVDGAQWIPKPIHQEERTLRFVMRQVGIAEVKLDGSAAVNTVNSPAQISELCFNQGKFLAYDGRVPGGFKFDGAWRVFNTSRIGACCWVGESIVYSVYNETGLRIIDSNGAVLSLDTQSVIKKLIPCSDTSVFVCYEGFTTLYDIVKLELVTRDDHEGAKDVFIEKVEDGFVLLWKTEDLMKLNYSLHRKGRLPFKGALGVPNVGFISFQVAMNLKHGKIALCGFEPVGQTHHIKVLDLLKQKPKESSWCVLF
jgi:hypothetical protein